MEKGVKMEADSLEKYDPKENPDSMKETCQLKYNKGNQSEANRKPFGILRGPKGIPPNLYHHGYCDWTGMLSEVIFHFPECL